MPIAQEKIGLAQGILTRKGWKIFWNAHLYQSGTWRNGKSWEEQRTLNLGVET